MSGHVERTGPFAGLSRSIVNALINAGVRSAADTDEMTDDEVLGIKNLGARGALELRTVRLRQVREAQALRQDYVRPNTILGGGSLSSGQQQLAEQRRMTAVLERIEQHLRHQGLRGVA